MPTNYPGSLDTFPNPAATTFRDTPGFELDIVVSNLGDAVEQVEQKLGVGASTPVVPGLLRAVSTGGATWGQLQTNDIGFAQITTPTLAPNAATAIWSATPTTNSPSTNRLIGSSTALLEQMSVPIGTAGGLVLVIFDAIVTISAPGNTIFFELYADGATLKQYPVAPSTAGFNTHIGMVHVYAPSAAAHTIEVRWAVTGGTAQNTGVARGLTVVEFRR